MVVYFLFLVFFGPRTWGGYKTYKTRTLEFRNNNFETSVLNKLIIIKIISIKDKAKNV